MGFLTGFAIGKFVLEKSDFLFKNGTPRKTRQAEKQRVREMFVSREANAAWHILLVVRLWPQLLSCRTFEPTTQ